MEESLLQQAEPFVTTSTAPADVSAVTPSGATISVVIPARNEAGTIVQVVERSFAAMAALGRKGEVLVVNDGSSDATGALLTGLEAQYPSLRIFTNRRSQGMTAGLQRMFEASRGDIVILIPADMESDPLLDLPALVHAMEANDLGRGGGLAAGAQGWQGLRQRHLQLCHAQDCGRACA